MLTRGPGKEGAQLSSVCVFVFLPRYLVDTWRELRTAIAQNKPAIDRMVQTKVEQELHSQRLDIPFRLFSLSKCTLRRDFILEYRFDLPTAA